MKWYFYKNKKVQGYCPGKKKVARFAGCSISELVIQKVKWNGEEWVAIRN